MKRITFLLLFLFLISTQAQVTITESDVATHLAVGNTITTYSDTLGGTVNIGSTGQSSWDFSNQPIHLEFDATSIVPSSSPAAGTFGGANYATYSNPTFAGVTSETWVHLSLNNGAYSDLGTYTTAATLGFTTVTTIEISPAEDLLRLPLNLGDSWTQSGTRSFDVSVAGFGQSYDVDYNITRTVDAWGTLTMPNGSVENVLRIKIESELTSNVTGTPTTTNSLSFMFISPSGASLTATAADANAGDNGNISIADVSWYYGNGASTDVEQLDELATDFSLEQNYPNPFNPTTNIQYSIPKASHVSLKVYDVLGNEVANLVNENLSPGIYNTKLDGSALSSGIYFYTLSAGNFTATKKLMLVK